MQATSLAFGAELPTRDSERQTALDAAEDSGGIQVGSTLIVAQPAAALDDRQRELEAHAEAIRRLSEKGLACLVEIGHRLIAVKKMLRHGEFGKWIDENFNFGERHANRFVQVADVFGEVDNLSDLNIDDSAAFKLAAPSAPAEALEEALERARQGERITHAEAMRILEKHRHPPARSAARIAVQEVLPAENEAEAAFKPDDDFEPVTDVDGPVEARPDDPPEEESPEELRQAIIKLRAIVFQAYHSLPKRYVYEFLDAIRRLADEIELEFAPADFDEAYGEN